MYRFDGSTVLVIKTDMTHTVTHQTTHILPPAGTQNALDEEAELPRAGNVAVLGRPRAARGPHHALTSSAHKAAAVAEQLLCIPAAAQRLLAL